MHPYELLIMQGWVLTLLGPVLLLAQLACLIHVIRSGRPYWWLWVIFGFPIVGLTAYLLLEVRQSVAKGDLHTLLWRLKSSPERIRILEEALADSTTVKNRLRLSDELHAAHQFDRECQVLAEGLRGPFKDDPQLLMRLAQAHLEAGRVDEAAAMIARTTPERSLDSQLQHSLLKARVLSKQGRADEAMPIFRELIARNRSEGPRYFYAEYLLQSGQRIDEARAILNDILLRYRRGTPVWRFQERRWFYAAKRLLKQPPNAVAMPSKETSVVAEVVDSPS